jgi:hypothetical protein
MTADRMIALNIETQSIFEYANQTSLEARLWKQIMRGDLESFRKLANGDGAIIAL